MPLPSLLLYTILSASPLDDAAAHLAAGRLDDVLFALDGKHFSGADRPRAAALLAQAAMAANRQHDALLGLQFAQMALSIEPARPEALEAGARSALAQEQFEAAEGYADRWLGAAPADASAHLLRAELHLEAGEWSQTIAQLDQAGPLRGAQAETARSMRAKATRELGERRSALSAVAALERQLEAAAARAKASERSTRRPAAPSARGGVVVYGTSWCGYCKKMKAFLRKKGVDFVEKDVERDPDAAKELAEKASAAGVRPGGVPVTDVKGTLVLGFDPAAVEAAL